MVADAYWWAGFTAPRYNGAGARAIAAELDAGIRDMAAELAAEREWRDRLAAAIAPIDVPAIGTFTAGPYLQPMWGPKDGYLWMVQRLTVATLGAADILQAYRGASVADVAGPQNLLNSWQGSLGAVQVWNPGRTGCMIKPRQTLIFAGTLTAGPYTINADVIQLEAWLLPYFLL